MEEACEPITGELLLEVILRPLAFCGNCGAGACFVAKFALCSARVIASLLRESEPQTSTAKVGRLESLI